MSSVAPDCAAHVPFANGLNCSSIEILDIKIAPFHLFARPANGPFILAETNGALILFMAAIPSEDSLL